jgi:signal transduction histidine kinase
MTDRQDSSPAQGNLKRESNSSIKGNALQEGQIEELTGVFMNLNEGIAFHDVVYDEKGAPVDYIVRNFNPSYLRIIGKSREEVINKKASSLFSTESPVLIDVFSKVAETKSPASLEFFYSPLKRYFKVSAYSEQKGKFVTMLEDISHRKHMETALRERIIALTQPIGNIEDITFESLFNLDEIQKIQDTFATATGVASLIVAPDGTPITKPSNFCNLCTNIIRNSPKGCANCKKSDSIIGAANSNGPTVQICLSGGLFDGGAAIMLGNHHIASWLVGQILDEGYDEAAMRKYAREIEVDEELFLSELNNVYKMSKAQFEKICEALYLIANQISDMALNNLQQARLIGERTKNEEKIRALNYELTQKNKELEQIVYVASHDLRSPLVNIQGFGKELREDIEKLRDIVYKSDDLNEIRDLVENAISSRMTESFEYIFRSARKMDLLISSLLRLSRLDRSPITVKKVKMNNLVREVLRNFEHQLNVSGCEIVIEMLPDCFCDEFMIFQVLSSYIDNAVKFTNPGKKGVIKISGQIFDDNIEYCVSDNGKGVALENQEKIFDLFRRLDHKVSGEGLGLTIVKKIISKHNGACRVESEPGNGSRFYFSIPIIKES